MLFGAFSECKWNLSLTCIQIAAAGFFCSHQLRLFCIPPRTHWRDSADWLRELHSAFILHPPKTAESASRNWVDQRHRGKGRGVSPLSGVSCALYCTAQKGLGIERSIVSERDAEEAGRDHQCPWNAFIPQPVWCCRALHGLLPNNS